MATDAGIGWKIPLVALLVLHCNDAATKASETDGSASTTTAPQDSDTTPTGGGTATDTEGGGSHAVCERYLGCVAATAPEALPAAQMGYAENGTCWQAGPDSAELCITACRTGLEKFHQLFPDEPACNQCAVDEECDVNAGELCSSAGECALRCVNDLPGGCICRVNEDCGADHVCVDEECRTSLTCGDGKVGADEICDGQDGCDPDCAGPLQCSPLTNLGCTAGQVCRIDGSCMDAPADLPGNGEACVDSPGTVACAVGHLCESGDYNPDCPFDACCWRLCNLDGTDDCPGGMYCSPLFDLPPQLAYIGLCV